MHLTYLNVNHAFHGLVNQFADPVNYGQIITEQPSRNGPVYVCNEPVMVTYQRPMQRVLFNTARDCNPFFALYESLWMLAGRNDVTPLAYYNSRISQYSDDGETFNGAYGYRWRHGRRKTNEVLGVTGRWQDDVDQIKLLINHLKKEPNSRRAVLNMWNVHDDLLRIDGQGWGKSLDVCCNLSMCFSIRDAGVCKRNHKDPECICPEVGHDTVKHLDMTVFNRSNDLIWGMLGEDYVHFSILQEYVTIYLGVEVGVYNQITNNLHVYKDNWKPEEWNKHHDLDEYPGTQALVQDPRTFDQELDKFVEVHSKQTRLYRTLWEERFLNTVAGPMCMAWHMHKRREYDKAFEWCDRIAAEDWHKAAENWISKRACNYVKKLGEGRKEPV